MTGVPSVDSPWRSDLLRSEVGSSSRWTQVLLPDNLHTTRSRPSHVLKRDLSLAKEDIDSGILVRLKPFRVPHTNDVVYPETPTPHSTPPLPRPLPLVFLKVGRTRSRTRGDGPEDMEHKRVKRDPSNGIGRQFDGCFSCVVRSNGRPVDKHNLSSTFMRYRPILLFFVRSSPSDSC